MSKAYAFLGSNSHHPFTYPSAVVGNGAEFYPLPNFSELGLLIKKDFKVKKTIVDGTNVLFLKYKGKKEGIFQVNLTVSILLTNTNKQPASSTYILMLYKGSKGKFPTKPIPSITVSYTLTQDLIYNASGSGLLRLEPGDTLALYYSSLESIPSGSLFIYDYEFAVNKIDSVNEC